ncbi:MAG: ABC transporter permease [Chloroflexota bacterium]
MSADTTVSEDGIDLPPPAEPTTSRGSWLRRALGAIALPLLALFSAAVVGGIVIIAGNRDVVGLLETDLPAGLSAGWSVIIDSYAALIRGALGDPAQLVSALVSLDPHALVDAFHPLAETTLSSTPVILTGLSVALAFRAGLFNIGGEGQLQLGALASVLVGFSIQGLPWFIHLPLALIAGIIAGAAWGFIPGFLKARTGAHEVITTIMLNFIAIQLVGFALRTPLYQRPGRTDPISKSIEPSAVLPPLVDGLRAHWGIVLAIIAAIFVSWLIFRAKKGFEFRAVGLNPIAARYAGMNIGATTVLAMMAAGGLAGLAGSAVVLGTTHNLIPNLGGGAGFDGIAIALLGRSRPSGVVAAGFLMGALRAGAVPMQVATGTPIYLVVVIQALIIMFIAAPALVRAIYRIKASRTIGAEAFAKGWGA